MANVNYTPATWVTGENPSATKLNTEIRDPWTNAQSAWTSWTPTWVGVTIGTSTVTAVYKQIGKTVTARLSMQLSSTASTTGSGLLSFSPPVPVASNYLQYDTLGSGCITDVSLATRYACSIVMFSTVKLQWLYQTTSVTATAPFNFGPSDSFTAQITYEAA